MPHLPRRSTGPPLLRHPAPRVSHSRVARVVAGRELIARFGAYGVQGLDRVGVRPALERRVGPDSLEPTAEVLDSQLAFERLLGNTGDVEARLASPLGELVGEVDVHPRHT